VIRGYASEPRFRSYAAHAITPAACKANMLCDVIIFSVLSRLIQVPVIPESGALAIESLVISFIFALQAEGA
jgi:hypothetical protein